MNSIPSKRTPFYPMHLERGAKLVDFAGWEMPLQYEGIIEEHNNTRDKAGLFDTSHMGEIEVTGPAAFDYLQYILTNDLEKLTPGRCFYSAMCYENGCTIDDCFIYMFSKEKFWIVVNASNSEKDFQWLKKHTREGVQITDISEETAKLDLQGPVAAKILEKIIPGISEELKRFQFKEYTKEGQKFIISRTGYTGEDGFELYFSQGAARLIWDLLMEYGIPQGLKPAGLGARDTLRLESCYSLYAHELHETITPVEAGVGWVVKEYKADFIGKKLLAYQKEKGPEKKLVAFELLERGIPRMDHKIFFNGKEEGIVTSGTFSPTLKKSIGLGYINSKYSDIDNIIDIEIRGKYLRARIVRKPFYEFQGGVKNG